MRGGWKGVRTRVRLKNRTVRAGRSPKNTSAGATVHFASLMDTCHLKNAELEAKHQKYKGRVVLRGDIVKRRLRVLRSFIHQTGDHQHHI